MCTDLVELIGTCWFISYNFSSHESFLVFSDSLSIAKRYMQFSSEGELIKDRNEKKIIIINYFKLESQKQCENNEYPENVQERIPSELRYFSNNRFTWEEIMNNNVPKVVKYMLLSEKELFLKHIYFYMPFTTGKNLMLRKGNVDYHPSAVSI